MDISGHDEIIQNDFWNAVPNAPRNTIFFDDRDMKDAELTCMTLRHKGLMVGLFTAKEDGRKRWMLI